MIAPFPHQKGDLTSITMSLLDEYLDSESSSTQQPTNRNSRRGILRNGTHGSGACAALRQQYLGGTAAEQQSSAVFCLPRAAEVGMQK